MATETYYIVKVKGKAKIPDYIQVRDHAFTLIGYFRPNRNAAQNKSNDPNQQLFAQIENFALELPFGVVTRVEINPEA